MYASMDTEQLKALKDQLENEYAQIKAKGLSLNMARGKPAAAQLDLSMPMLSCLADQADCTDSAGTD